MFEKLGKSEKVLLHWNFSEKPPHLYGYSCIETLYFEALTKKNKNNKVMYTKLVATTLHQKWCKGASRVIFGVSLPQKLLNVFHYTIFGAK